MAATCTLPHGDPELKEVLLGFLESASSLCDMMNTTMAAVLNEVMSIQADEACGAAYGRRDPNRTNSRNGYRERGLQTSVGTLDLRIPKLRRGSYFPTEILERYQRVDQALAAAVAEMYVTGTSTRKVERVAAKLGVDGLSKDQVSRLCAVLDSSVEAFRSRRFDGERFCYVFLDATYVKCREAGRVRSRALVVAIGVGADGRRRFLGLACANAESYASWRGFLGDLEERGVSGVRLVTSDAHEGLRRAVAETWPDATWQRCVAHLKRDVAARAGGREAARRAAACMAPVFAESDPALVRALYHGAADALREVSEDAARTWEDAELDALAYLSFPREHRLKVRTNNVCERVNAELKRRARVVQAFPSEASALRLLGAVCEEQEGDWEVGNRFMSPSSIAPMLGDGWEAADVGGDPGEDEVRSAGVIIRASLAGLERAA